MKRGVAGCFGMLALWAVSAAAPAADARQYYRFDGVLTEDRLGVAVGELGDINGDGRADVLVGARYADVGGLADAGSVSVFSGADGTELLHLNGSGAGDWFGVSVAGIGDLNGDGAPEFIVGAQFARNASNQQTGGAAYVFSGSSGARMYELYGGLYDGRFGVSVAGGQDIDGDGLPDFVVGAYMEGAAYVYSGANGALIAKLAGMPGTWYGFAVALLPNTNGDGRGEIVVSAPQSGAGTVQVYSGMTRDLLYTLNGEQDKDWFGFSVAAAGDLNGDKKSEVLVGAREASPAGRTNAGSVYVYEAKDGNLLRRLDGSNGRDAFGTSVFRAGDINRDGVNDFIVGARFALDGTSQPTGRAYLFSGADGSELVGVTGEASQDWFGGSVAAVGDIDGDGWPEWVVGAAGADPGGNSNAGRAYVFGLKHYDLAVTSVNAPSSARPGDAIAASYTVVNHGEATPLSISLTVNGVRKTSSVTSLNSLENHRGAITYVLRSGDFLNRRSTVCVDASPNAATDAYSADNAKCVQVAQAF